MQRLPIDDHLDAAVKALAAHRRLVLTAEPGAGKTTRLPPALVDGGLCGDGTVLVLQPRRVAARMAATRIAAERGDEVGGFAGYTVRFDRRVSRRTRVHVVTEGILTKLATDDPSLEGIAAVVLDEFHERSVHADVALALVRTIQKELRPDLHLVVMSATLDAEPIARWLDAAPTLHVPGRTYPINITWLDVPDDRPLPVKAAAAVRRALATGPGDVLVFLPGVGEIQRTGEALAGLASEQGLAVLPLHGELRPEEQDAALGPSDRRKVILATNVAETSLTVPGVTTVIDAGLAKISAFDADTGLDRLELKRISKASATQRAGRAGRLGPGRAFRLWTKNEEAAMPPFEVPEIRRVDMAPVALDLHAFGEHDVAGFPWFESPGAAVVDAAESVLRLLGAVDPTTRRLTPLGERLTRFPAHPRVARLLVEGHARGAVEETALAAALLSERDFVRRGTRDLPAGPCDVSMRVDLMRGDVAGEIDRQALRTVRRVAEHYARTLRDLLGAPPASTEDSETAVRRAFLAAFPDRVARRREPGKPDALMVGGRGVALAPESVVREAECFVVLDADLGARGLHAKAVVRLASAVERSWLDDVPGHPVATRRDVRWDDARGRVIGVVESRYLDLPLSVAETGNPDPAETKRLLLEVGRRDPSRVLDLSGSVEALWLRLRSLASWMPELHLPPLDPSDLVDLLEPWMDGATTLDAMRALPLDAVIRGALSREQADALERHAPESLLLPSGQRRKLEYVPSKAPILAVKLQELFGCAETPTVAHGRVPVLLHLLSPGHQVVQVTSDLKSFWNTTYAQVRKDLRGRYPRHPWPDDPWTATPTSRAKPRGT